MVKRIEILKSYLVSKYSNGSMRSGLFNHQFHRLLKIQYSIKGSPRAK